MPDSSSHPSDTLPDVGAPVNPGVGTRPFRVFMPNPEPRELGVQRSILVNESIVASAVDEETRKLRTTAKQELSGVRDIRLSPVVEGRSPVIQVPRKEGARRRPDLVDGRRVANRFGEGMWPDVHRRKNPRVACRRAEDAGV